MPSAGIITELDIQALPLSKTRFNQSLIHDTNISAEIHAHLMPKSLSWFCGGPPTTECTLHHLKSCLKMHPGKGDALNVAVAFEGAVREAA